MAGSPNHYLKGQIKLYFYDWAYLMETQSEGGSKFENLVASHLLKHVQFLNDSDGRQLELHFMRTVNGSGRSKPDAVNAEILAHNSPKFDALT
jgi:predicted AAA+ superfamily ATPase